MSQCNRSRISKLIGVSVMSELVKVGKTGKKKKKAQCQIKSPDFRPKGTTKGVTGEKSIKETHEYQKEKFWNASRRKNFQVSKNENHTKDKSSHLQ